MTPVTKTLSKIGRWELRKEIEKGEYEPMGEDLFAEMCLRKTGVTMLDAFDIIR